MITTIKKIDSSYPVINPDTGIMTEHFRLFILEVQATGLYIGTGTPEGALEAKQGTEYMDESGAPGSIKYIKQKADIAGDRAKGWIAIG